jgi:hypothetical protein
VADDDRLARPRVLLVVVGGERRLRRREGEADGEQQHADETRQHLELPYEFGYVGVQD